MAGAMVGDVEKRVGCEVTKDPGVGIDPAGVEKQRGRDLFLAQNPMSAAS